MVEVIGSTPIFSTKPRFFAGFLFDMYFVYILYSASKNKFYVGQTDSIGNRLKSHSAGMSPYTSTADDWNLVYYEEFQTRTEAIRREKEIKKKKSRRYIEELVKSKISF